MKTYSFRKENLSSSRLWKSCISAICFICCLAGTSCSSTVDMGIKSRNGKIKISYERDTDPHFVVSYCNQEKQTEVFTLSEIGLVAGEKADSLRLVSVSNPVDIQIDYQMLQGKRKHCHNRGVERIYCFENAQGIRMNLTFQVFDDGIAFRYSYPTHDELVITDERTTFVVPDKIKRWTQPLNGAYEDFYPQNTDGAGKYANAQSTWGFPALFEVADSTWLLLSEANIRRGNCGSWLSNTENKSAYKVRMSEKSLKCTSDWTSPWRVAIIGTLANIVESTLITDVSEPSKVDDVSWIKPGIVSWIYWAYNHGSKDYQIVKKYIDFAVDMQLPYILIDWEWDEMANGGDIQKALSYAKEKGIKPLLWYNSSTAWAGAGSPGPLFRLNTAENREKEMKDLQEKGVKGLKIDFFNQDSLSTMTYFMDLLEDAAKYQLMINFHGATIPRGWQRTYPHLMSIEGVYGAEWYNNDSILTDNAAWHNCTLPFTRNVVGPMDYTPCTFTDSQYPHRTTNGHELALSIVFESALLHLPDRPEGYLSQPKPIQSFITHLPTTWDDTKLLSGYPSDHIIIARKKGTTWYVAGLNGSDEARSLSFNLDFTDTISSEIRLFKDGSGADTFNIESVPTDSRSFSVDCLPRGGFVLIIK